VNRESVEDFIAKDNPLLCLGSGRRSYYAKVLLPGSYEAVDKDFTFAGAGFAGSVVEGPVKCVVLLTSGLKNVDGKGAILGANFEDRKDLRAAVSFPDLMDPYGEKLSVGCTDTDAGRKVTSLPNPAAA
tara:strand:- start:132 stop:518 length:387 start_codon:yes stop_codon:yes gene_type:complete